MSDTKDQLLLIDLSGIAHMIFHVSGNEPDPSYISNQIIARVRALASAHPFAAVCCDAGKSFRADIDPQYKAQRDTDNRAVLRHQMDVACETLRKDGFPVWRVKGYESDDLIATATTQALAIDGASVLIASADKDMTQLISDRVSMKKLTDGSIVGPAEVIAKFKVPPSMMHDFLCLVGDVSDNIIGARGIGGVTAAKLLNAHGSIQALYDAMAKGVVKELTPALRTSMQEFRERWPIVSQLVTLKTDVAEVSENGSHFQFAEIAAERVPEPMEAEMGEPFKEGDDSNDAPLPWAGETVAALEAAKAQQVTRHDLIGTSVMDRELSAPAAGDAVSAAAANVAKRIDAQLAAPVGPVVVAKLPEPYAAPVDFNQQLEPRNMEEAARLAGHMFKARLFNAYGTWEGVFSTILAGRELGIPAMASLRAFHIVESRPTMSADTMAALVLKSGKAKYFRCTERTDARCTFVTQRLPVEDYPEQKLTVTIEEMRAAWRKDDKAWAGSGWGKTPAQMLIAACKRQLARLEYPDVVGNIYDGDEVA